MNAASDTPTPQQLVLEGYQKARRRVYVVRLYDEGVAEGLAFSDENKLSLANKRIARWRNDGALPVRVFRELLTQWFCTEPKAPQVRFFLDVGLTFKGMQELQFHSQLLDVLRQRAPAFAQSAPRRAASYLCDTGSGDPLRWESHYHEEHAHVLLFVHVHARWQEPAPTPAAPQDLPPGFLDFEHAVHEALVACAVNASKPLPEALAPSGSPMAGAWIEQPQALSEDGRQVHFGMTDGISRPKFVDAKPGSDELNKNVHALGELFLGYARNDDSNAWKMPGALPMPSGHLTPLPTPVRAAYGAFFKDGSFGVLRKMQQDVDGFESYLEQQVKPLQGRWKNQFEDYQKAWLKAKLLGRWPNGEPLVGRDPESEPQPDPAIQQARMQPAKMVDKPANDFLYKDDRYGLQCPIGAHIRRMNPRDDPVVPFLRRPLLRRGMPYGSKGEAEKGMLGLFFCASLEEQFEHLLGHWANDTPMGMPQGADGRDPLIGNQDVHNAQFEFPDAGHATPVRLKGLPSFVTTRGTCYAFFPSKESLRGIAAGKTTTYAAFTESLPVVHS